MTTKEMNFDAAQLTCSNDTWARQSTVNYVVYAPRRGFLQRKTDVHHSCKELQGELTDMYLNHGINDAQTMVPQISARWPTKAAQHSALPQLRTTFTKGTGKSHVESFTTSRIPVTKTSILIPEALEGLLAPAARSCDDISSYPENRGHFLTTNISCIARDIST